MLLLQENKPVRDVFIPYTLKALSEEQRRVHILRILHAKKTSVVNCI